jgi:hypothetical protein
MNTQNHANRDAVSRNGSDLGPRLGSLLMAELYTWPGILTTLLEQRDLSV